MHKHMGCSEPWVHLMQAYGILNFESTCGMPRWLVKWVFLEEISTGIGAMKLSAHQWGRQLPLLLAWTKQKPRKDRWALCLIWEVHLLQTLDIRPSGLEAFLNFWTWPLGYTSSFQMAGDRISSLQNRMTRFLVMMCCICTHTIRNDIHSCRPTTTCTQQYPPHASKTVTRWFG